MSFHLPPAARFSVAPDDIEAAVPKRLMPAVVRERMLTAWRLACDTLDAMYETIQPMPAGELDVYLEALTCLLESQAGVIKHARQVIEQLSDALENHERRLR